MNNSKRPENKQSTCFKINLTMQRQLVQKVIIETRQLNTESAMKTKQNIVVIKRLNDI